MAYEVYREKGQRRALQTVGVEARGDVSGALATAQGLQTLGQGIGRVSDALAVRDELLADTDARKALEARAKARNDYFYAPETGLMNQRGGNGVNIRDDARSRLTEIDDEFAGNLSPRAQMIYRKNVDAARVDEDRQIDVHSSQQTERYIVEGRQATVNTALENAVLNYRDPAQFEKHLQEARAEQRALGGLMGTAPAEADAKDREVVSNAHRARILRVAVDDPMAAQTILEANRDKLSPEAQQALDTALEGPVTQAQADAFVSQFVGTPDQVRPDADARVLPRVNYGPTGNPVVDGAIETARAIGADPLDLLTAISYETGGTMDPRQMGPRTHRGQHRGLIQFGEEEALKYGVRWDDPINSQLGANGAVANYFRDRGYKPGMTGLDLYSTINAGRPGRHGASDAAVGGAPGSVADKWNSPQMAQHRAKAAKMLGMEGPYTAAERRAPGQKVLADAGLPVTPLNEFLVNNAGPDYGPKIAQALQTAPSTLVSTIIPGYDGPPGLTVARLADDATREMGADAASQSGRYIDTTGALDAAMSIQNPKVRAAAIQKIMQYDNLNNVARDRTAQAAFDQAWTDFKIGGSTNIPLDLQLQMGPGKLATLQETMRRDGQITTDMDVYETLMSLSSSPKSFADMDLRDFRAALSEEDYRFFLGQQRAAQMSVDQATETALGKKIEANEKGRFVDYDKAWKGVTDIFEANGLPQSGKEVTDKTRQQTLQARREFNAQVSAFVGKEGRAPNELETRQIAMDLVLPVKFGGAGGGWATDKAGSVWEYNYAKPGTTVKANVKAEDIPSEQRASIAAEIEAQGGKPTSAEVAAEFGRRALAAQGVPVAAKLSDVPAWAAAQLRAAGVAEVDLVAYYNGYMTATYGNQ